LDYLNQQLGQFLESVSSGEPAPGGGAVAAVAVASAAGLSGMAARFSTKQLDDATKLAERADLLRERVAPLAQADAESYEAVLAAYRLPRDSQNRGQRIQAALTEAADVPLSIAEVGAEVAELAVYLVDNGSLNMEGDTVAAVLLAEAGTRAASGFAEFNLKSLGESGDEQLRWEKELVEKAGAARQALLERNPTGGVD
jgi:formiminotetrahydrofolate cyclodeaminase